MPGWVRTGRLVAGGHPGYCPRESPGRGGRPRRNRGGARVSGRRRCRRRPRSTGPAGGRPRPRWPRWRAWCSSASSARSTSGAVASRGRRPRRSTRSTIGTGWSPRSRGDPGWRSPPCRAGRSPPWSRPPARGTNGSSGCRAPCRRWGWWRWSTAWDAGWGAGGRPGVGPGAVVDGLLRRRAPPGGQRRPARLLHHAGALRRLAAPARRAGRGGRGGDRPEAVEPRALHRDGAGVPVQGADRRGAGRGDAGPLPGDRRPAAERPARPGRRAGPPPVPPAGDELALAGLAQRPERRAGLVSGDGPEGGDGGGCPASGARHPGGRLALDDRPLGRARDDGGAPAAGGAAEEGPRHPIRPSGWFAWWWAVGNLAMFCTWPVAKPSYYLPCLPAVALLVGGEWVRLSRTARAPAPGRPWRG